MEPQLGEIWRIKDTDNHFIIVDTYDSFDYFGDQTAKQKWKFMHLNNGEMNGAFLLYFNLRCEKVA
jgi:hypothetical protein